MQALPLEIIYEDNHLLAVNKRASEIVQGDKTGDKPLSEKAKEYLKNKYHKKGNVFLGIPHRLDRPVSGVVLLARTGKALKRLNALFRTGEIKKTYWALVQNPPPQMHDRLNHFICKNEKLNKSYVSPNRKKGYKMACLEYRLLGKTEHYYLLEIDLLTGRHHQIRAQLAAIGCAIKGDVKYGSKRSNADGSVSLHARSLSFLHPVSRHQLSITACPPDDPIWNRCLEISKAK